MERQNLNAYIFLKYITDSVQPSLLEKIESNINDANIWYFKDLCRTSEDKLRQFPHVTDELVNDIKSYLDEHGLKLGMTEEELNDYKDAEFFEKHPRIGGKPSKQNDDVISIESVRIMEQKENDLLKEIVNDNNIQHKVAEETLLQSHPTGSTNTNETVSEKKAFDPFIEMRRAYADCMYDPARNMETDGEWIFHQVRLCMLREQPWFIKWFVPFDIRIKMAFDKADIIMKQYKKNAVERSVVFREKHADGSLERMRSGD
jgi:hypothetical protein